MSHPQGVRACLLHKRAWVAVLSIAICATWGSTWRTRAQNQSVGASNAVQRLDAKAPARAVNPTDRGATYQWLDERAIRVTTTFADAVAVTERIPGGDLRTRLTDSSGRDLGEFAVDRVGAGSDVLTFKKGEEFVRASGRPGVQPTLDWSNRQAYAMWKDKATDAAVALEWQGDLIRARSGPPVDFHERAVDVRTDWLDGFSAKATRTVGQRPDPRTGAPTRGTSLDSRLTRDNVEVGRSRWYPEEQVYVWSVPGLTKGYMDADRMKDVGGWTFTPDLAWVNVQSYAFHYFHTLIATQGFVSEAAPASRSWLARLAEAVAPTVYANEPGCDGLHYLDGTIFRACCDAHDRCYGKYGCSWRSWWEWWSSWSCVACNIGVTFCIISAHPPYSQSFP